MLSQLTISQQNTSQTAFDYQQLYAIGLKHVQRLSSRIWTDYNVHDPGITTLELLCYALSELSYRASFPIADLLASESANSENMQQQFFTARQILPNRPLTLLDYRKLLIDLEGVKNAWLQPATKTYYADIVKGKVLLKNPNQPGIVEVNLAGLYDVIIEYTEAIADESAKEKVIAAVKQRLQSHRNLCEDFVKFTPVETQTFILCTELELTPDADVAKVKAEILFQVQDYLAPSVKNYSLNEMLERTKADGSFYTADEIFDGPVLETGFIDNEELAQANLRIEIRLSDIISIIMDIPGVRAVRDIVINPASADKNTPPVPLTNKWLVPVESGKKALLERGVSRLVFYKRNMPVIAPQSQYNDEYQKLFDAARDKEEKKVAYDFDIPLGKYRHLGNYYSFQNDFPAVYGLSESGLSNAVGEKRQALAYQLKAYLLFFDQLMANYFAQLSHVKDLFSTDPQFHRTYFYQVVDSFANYNNIYSTADVIDTLQIDNDVQEVSSGLHRRHRFLDHLIARFAERFSDFAAISYVALGFSPQSLVSYKCEFLNNYPVISSERSLAYNYSLKTEGDLWNTENVSGLEKRLARLLGIRNYRRRNLSEIVYDADIEVYTNPSNEFSFRINKKDTTEVLSSTSSYATSELAQQALERTIDLALLPSGYERKVENGQHYFNIIDQIGNVLARSSKDFDNVTKMNQAIDEIIEYLQEHYSNEGMYLIENILLRPEPDQESDPFLPICPDPNCTDCTEADPYSYRIHIILPNYTSRFSNMYFRQFVETVIREETPAHILPKICWISKEDMATLEKLYRDWIYLKAEVDTTQRQEKLAKFIETLFKVKNVYPSNNLYECNSPEEEPKFILGTTALGTAKKDKA
ncbi:MULTISPECIES: diguanylate cyclase [Nostoc]|uniref:Diguanylate cyclase n=2 Tax=Nostoc TaxID=1177 RepID=A0ABR8IHQ6_9NOSO|nr:MULTISPECIES: diguanylate cyclase [Nostoc]MBD2563978.1 diguanylate cyclase [Nostoc linckia FACHB-391]MBD2650434.1 diguanylate cyclase [Nostoc foliaceum FACHB-393]